MDNPGVQPALVYAIGYAQSFGQNFTLIFCKCNNYAPHMKQHSDSKFHTLASMSILGQAS